MRERVGTSAVRAARWGALVLAAGSLAACQDRNAPPPDRVVVPAGEKPDTSLRRDRDPRVFYRSMGEPEYLDPGLCSEGDGGAITLDNFEGLYVFGPTHRELRPGVATGHEVSPDGRTYTFTLRRDARWSDGQPVTAHDFAWSWRRVLDPATASRYAGLLWIIEGGRAFSEFSGLAADGTPLPAEEAAAQKAALREAVGVRALDEATLEVRLVGPVPYFTQLTAFYTFAPTPRHVIEARGERWARPEGLGTPGVISNGPWRVTEWRTHQHIIAERNPHYWDAASIPFDRVVYRITQENEPAHNLFLAGDLDFLDGRVPPSALTRYRKERSPLLESSPYLGVYYFMFNVKRPPFDDVRVRRALNLSINKELIGRFVVKGGQVEAWTMVHPGLADVGYDPPPGPEYDPDLAAALLAEAGYPEGAGFPSFQISYNTMETHKLLAEFVQQAWSKHLGLRVDLDNMEWKVLLKKQHAHDFEISRSAWIGDYVDPMTFLEIWEGDNPQNQSQWKHPDFDTAIAEARVAVDPVARMRSLRRAEEVFLREVPGIPLYFYVKHDLVHPWVHGYPRHLQGVHLTRYFRIEL